MSEPSTVEPAAESFGLSPAPRDPDSSAGPFVSEDPDQGSAASELSSAGSADPDVARVGADAPPADTPRGAAESAPTVGVDSREGAADAAGDPEVRAAPGTAPARRRRRKRPSGSSAAATKTANGQADRPGPGPGLTEMAPPAFSPEVPAPGDAQRRVPRPRIGDTRPAPAPVSAVTPTPVPGSSVPPTPVSGSSVAPTPVPGGGRPSAELAPAPASPVHASDSEGDEAETSVTKSGRSRRRSGRERRGRPVGRYLMCVHVRPRAIQVAVLEGRTLVEHYVSRASDDATQIDGNIYRGRVQNVLPGMEAAFIDIGTPKNAVLYRGDVRYDRDDIETASSSHLRIEQMLKPGQLIVCQVTKNPIGAKGARLTQEVSLPGRFVVMVPNSSAFGISKRLDDTERRRLRRIVDDTRPKGHGLIVRTAAEGASHEELEGDVNRLMALWTAIEEEANRSNAPGLLYREPDLAVRIVREEFNREYRGVVIDDPDLFSQVRDYIQQVNPELADRVEYYDPTVENLPIFERFHVHEQLHKALDRKVWLPSGGSIIIERTEALTVIDVNTGKNVGTSNLEETVYRNNLEAAEEIARQLRLRDIGGIIVVDFIDMEIRENRGKVASALRSALARDKTRTQVFDISDLGLVEMTRKRVSEGLVESLSGVCAVCGGRGIVLDESLL